MFASMLILFSHFLRKPLFFGSYFGDFDALSLPGVPPPLKLQFGKGGGLLPPSPFKGTTAFSRRGALLGRKEGYFKDIACWLGI